MPRRVRDKDLETRAARQKLKVSGKPYYRAIGRGLHLGYRKGKNDGRWVARVYLGEQSYKVETLATADDARDADGIEVLTFWQAQEAARKKLAAQPIAGAEAGSLTVRKAVEEYLAFLEKSRKSVLDARHRAAAFIYDQLGDIEVAALTTKQLRDWLDEIASAPPRIRTRAGEPQRYRKVGSDAESIRRRRSTANRTLTVLKAALNRQWREGHVPSDTAWRRVEPFEAVEAARVRYLSIAEAKRLINASSPEFRPLVRAALYTGAPV